MKAKLLITFLLCAFLISGCFYCDMSGNPFPFSDCNFCEIKGNGKIKKEKREITDFTKLEVGGVYRLNIKCGGEPSLTITAEENLLPLIRTRVLGDKLKIDNKKNITTHKDIIIEITVNELNSIECSGAAIIDVKEIDTQEFDVDLSGAACINLEGETKKLHIQLSGAGNFDSSELKAKDVYISVSGAANAIVYASNFLDASVYGVGSIVYYGNPKNTKTNVSGFGSIMRK